MSGLPAPRNNDQYAETGNARLCSLRADVIMALHDISAQSLIAAHLKEQGVPPAPAKEEA